jgi:hypothetical protein
MILPLFPVGHVVATPAAVDAMEEAGVDPKSLLDRHVVGDFGDMDDVDKEKNRRAVREGTRVFSGYRLSTGETIYVITEADRSSTTFMLPDDY